MDVPDDLHRVPAAVEDLVPDHRPRPHRPVRRRAPGVPDDPRLRLRLLRGPRRRQRLPPGQGRQRHRLPRAQEPPAVQGHQRPPQERRPRREADPVGHVPAEPDPGVGERERARPPCDQDRLRRRARLRRRLRPGARAHRPRWQVVALADSRELRERARGGLHGLPPLHRRVRAAPRRLPDHRRHPGRVRRPPRRKDDPPRVRHRHGDQRRHDVLLHGPRARALQGAAARPEERGVRAAVRRPPRRPRRAGPRHRRPGPLHARGRRDRQRHQGARRAEGDPHLQDRRRRRLALRHGVRHPPRDPQGGVRARDLRHADRPRVPDRRRRAQPARLRGRPQGGRRGHQGRQGHVPRHQGHGAPRQGRPPVRVGHPAGEDERPGQDLVRDREAELRERDRRLPRRGPQHRRGLVGARRPGAARLDP
mmetsp:Transcript_18710/g.58016  ORF Transcript_18710/g.58016 Transcript_18710/m.58016 type:complete len:422 (+) Transcript_18710:1476-2741(+)